MPGRPVRGQSSDRTWVIVRPVSLTDDPGSGNVELSADPVSGKVSRDHVAAVLAAALQEPRSAGRIIYLRSGDTPVAQALETFLADSAS
ncbi:MAG TPA: NAD(P)H-binding protein [Solirubrobacterales bacterium]